MRLGAVLKKWRFSSEMDLDSAAKKMGLSRSILSRIEQGRVPDGETLIKLWHWLNSEESNGISESSGEPASAGKKLSDAPDAGEGK
jgi:transcriptional regulator with XRE-family HTH domain